LRLGRGEINGRKTITVCQCQKCKAVWHVLPDAEPTTA
jgi:hypothetical protein